MKPHLQYLRYVLLHKLYVARAGVAIRGWSPLWLWRLLVHDLSKFSRAEWGPYVAMFYGKKTSTTEGKDGAIEAKNRASAFNRAWLHHQHRNSHHWQHWILREDSGATIILLAPAEDVDEMIADWIGAGTKILLRPSLKRCVAETIVWYVNNAAKIQLREVARNRVEHVLMALADDYGLVAPALALHQAAQTRATLTLGG